MIDLSIPQMYIVFPLYFNDFTVIIGFKPVRSSPQLFRNPPQPLPSEERIVADNGGGLRRVAESDMFIYYTKSIAIAQVSATLSNLP